MAIDLVIHTKPGRPSKILNEDIKKKVIEYVAAGNYIGTACRAAGIHPETLTNWLHKAKIVEQYIKDNNISDDNVNNIELPDDIYNNIIYFELFENLKTAEAMAEAKHVSNLMVAGSAGPQFWAASATYLERKFPERWAKRDAIDDALKAGTELLSAISNRIKEISNTAIKGLPPG